MHYGKSRTQGHSGAVKTLPKNKKYTKHIANINRLTAFLVFPYLNIFIADGIKKIE